MVKDVVARFRSLASFHIFISAPLFTSTLLSHTPFSQRSKGTYYSVMVSEQITTISPSTNTPILTRPAATPSEIKSIGQNAQSAFLSFRKSHPTLDARAAIVSKALDILESRIDVLSKEITEQMGRPIAYTPVEITTAIKRARYMLRIAPEALANTPGDPEKGFNRYIQRRPVGVVLVIFAWNYPYLILVNSLIPALLAGNALILKPSPQTPIIVEHMIDIFREAGLPDGVLQYLHVGSPHDLRPLILSKDVNHVTFTGSVAAGLSIQQIASARIDLTVGLELGGKDPSYVRPDVDVAWAASEIVDGAVFNSGQSCCAIERVYVHEKIYDSFIDECRKVLAGYEVGDPFDNSTNVGPVISKKAKETILAHIKDAREKGAKDETPHNESFKTLPEDGNYVAPVLLTDCNHDMTVMKDETFGPVIPIMPVSSDTEAIALMNDSVFGLTATIWTADTAKGEELAQDVHAGTVFVNRADYPSPDLAWTGWGDSGKGVTMGRWGFEQFVKLRSVHVKDYPK